MIAIFTITIFPAYFDVKCLISLEINVLSYTISRIFLWKQTFEWKILTYFSQKIIDIKKNYKIYNAKLLTIIESFCYKRHYLKQLYYNIKLFIDYSNLHAL